MLDFHLHTCRQHIPSSWGPFWFFCACLHLSLNELIHITPYYLAVMCDKLELSRRGKHKLFVGWWWKIASIVENLHANLGKKNGSDWLGMRVHKVTVWLSVSHMQSSRPEQWKRGTWIGKRRLKWWAMCISVVPLILVLTFLISLWQLQPHILLVSFQARMECPKCNSSTNGDDPLMT